MDYKRLTEIDRELEMCEFDIEDIDRAKTGIFGERQFHILGLTLKEGEKFSFFIESLIRQKVEEIKTVDLVTIHHEEILVKLYKENILKKIQELKKEKKSILNKSWWQFWK